MSQLVTLMPQFDSHVSVADRTGTLYGYRTRLYTFHSR